MKRIKNYKLNYYDIDVIETFGETKKYNLIFYKNIIGKDGSKKELKTYYTLMKDYTLKDCLDTLDECLNVEKTGESIMDIGYYSGNMGLVISYNDEIKHIIKCIKHF